MEPTQNNQPNPYSSNEPKDNPQMIPMAIVAAGALIAAAIYFGGSHPVGSLTQGANSLTGGPTPSASIDVKDVSGADHIVGNQNAQVVAVEYSDLECPFCKVFHNTMRQIMNTYTTNQVAWVYRHFPIAQLHSKAPKEAEASECAFAQGGNTAFWAFINKVFDTTNSNDSLDASQLPKIAGEIGLDVNAFNTCLSSGKYTKEISDAVVAAGKAGAQGTPYTVLIGKNGQKVIVNGAEPFESVKAKIDSLLK
jgi:protein-disulfide isomerase